MTDERPKVIAPDRARQGVTGHNVRYVLMISMVLVIVALLGVALFIRG
jgi:hypothetical protein